MNEEEQIKGSIIHVMNLIIIELLRYGFMLAQERELKDLKHLVNTDEDVWMIGQGLICIDDEVELLECLDDAAVKLIVLSIDKIIAFKHTFLLINNLDEIDVIMNTSFFEDAQDSTAYYVYEMGCNDSYENILQNLNGYYWTIDMTLFHCVTQFVLGKLDVFEAAQDTYHSYYGVDYVLPCDNKNALLLLDLMPQLDQDDQQIDEHYRKIKKGK